MTEREIVKRERAAFIRGMGKGCSSSPCPSCERQAAELYPLPKVTRPRVVKAFGAEYRVLDGKLQYRWTSGGQWQTTSTMWPDSYRELVSLLDNPNETVEE